jgi:hypothetical protein
VPGKASEVDQCKKNVKSNMSLAFLTFVFRKQFDPLDAQPDPAVPLELFAVSFFVPVLPRGMGLGIARTFVQEKLFMNTRR